MEVPVARPLTTPVADTVATAGVAEVHGFVAFAVPVPLRLVVEPIQVFNTPEMVGAAITVTVAVTVQLFEFLYVMTEVPAATPVITPVAETVATVVVADVQGVVAFAVAEPVKAVVEPMQVLNVPVIVGAAKTVTVALTVQLLVFV